MSPTEHDDPNGSAGAAGSDSQVQPDMLAGSVRDRRVDAQPHPTPVPPNADLGAGCDDGGTGQSGTDNRHFAPFHTLGRLRRRDHPPAAASTAPAKQPH